MTSARRTTPLIHVCPQCGATKEWWASRRPYGLCAKCRGRRKNATQYASGNQAQHKHNMMRKYGLTTEQYDAMLDDQGGVCAICGRPPKNQRLHVDHEHRTGLVRGLLHGSCNQTLGFMHENVQWFQGAVDYLTDPPAFDVIGRHQVPGSPPLQSPKPSQGE